MGGINKRATRRILATLFVVILVGGVAHAVHIDAFNRTDHFAQGGDEAQATYLAFNNRDDSTSKWVKRDFSLNGKTVDLRAQTVDGTLVNNSDDTVETWTATINIVEDCFINNAWVGTVEIHQFVGTDSEKTQTLDLRQYDLGSIELEYLYDGDLLIPLKKGDYVVYYPSEADEKNIAPHSELTMGVIFYYLDDLNLSDYSISYRYHRDFTYGASFIALAVLVILWALLLAGLVVADVSYKRAARELELRKSGLFAMSSIYSLISFIDLVNDELIPIHSGAKTKEVLLQGPRANEQLREVFAKDTEAPFLASVLEFVDTGTLPERLKKGSISLEYMSKQYGWSEIRFFGVDTQDGQSLSRVLLTIRDINDEKHELERFEQRAAQMRLENSTRSTFVAGASQGMAQSVQIVDELAERILNQSDDESIRACAKQIRNRGKAMSYLIETTIDSSRSGEGGIQLAAKEYVFADMVSDALDVIETIALDRGCTFEVDIAPSVSGKLVGDARRIERALIGIAAYEMRIDRVRSVKLTVYSAARDGSEHILFSLKSDGSGISESEEREFEEFAANVEKYGPQAINENAKELEGVYLLLRFMDSRLQMVNDPVQSLELFFELEQEIVDAALPEPRGNDA